MHGGGFKHHGTTEEEITGSRRGLKAPWGGAVERADGVDKGEGNNMVREMA